MAVDFKKFEKLDTVASIKDAPSGNYLLSKLGLFRTVNSVTPRAQIVDIVENKSIELEQVARYGSEVNTIKMDKSVLRGQELPHVATEAHVTTDDWQGLVSPSNPDQSMAVTEVIAAKALRLRESHLETVEMDLSRSLFEQRAKAAKTEDGDVDFKAVFDTAPVDFELNTSMGSSFYQQLAKIKRQLVLQYGANRSHIGKFYMFCSPDLYDALLSSPEISTLVVNKVSDAAKGFFIPENIEGYDSFQIGNTTFICVDDNRYKIEEKSGLMVPKFTTADRNPFLRVQGPASRNQDIASKGVISPFYQKVMTDRYGMITLHQEYSHMAMNLRPNYTSLVKMKTK